MTRNTPLATTAAVAAAILGIAAAQPAVAAKTFHVEIAISGTDIAGETSQAQIRQGLRRQGRNVDERQVRRAAAIIVKRYKARRRSRQPGIVLIYFKTLNATVCASWGRHKGYCNKHAKTNFAGLKKSVVN